MLRERCREQVDETCKGLSDQAPHCKPRQPRLYIRHTKWQSRREEALHHPFQMGTVTPNGQCDASAKPNRSIAHSRQIYTAEMHLKCSRGQCCTAINLSPAGRREITSVSVSPLIPFNPFELMSSFTAHQPPHPTTLTYRRGYENRAKGRRRSH